MKNLIKDKFKSKEIDTNNKKRFSIILNKKLIITVVLIAVLGLGFLITNSVLNDQGVGDDKYSVLKLGSSINKINAKGEVKSEESAKVYSNVTLPIKEVKVKIHDKIKANDVLAILDTSKLEDKIRESESIIDATDAGNEVSLENAKSAYENALALSSDEKNQDIKNADVALNTAKREYENKKSIYEKYNQLHESDGISDQELKEYEISYENAKGIYDKSIVALDNTKAKINQDLTTAKNAYKTAKVKSEDRSLHVSLENLKKDLNNAVITSPVDGIISAVNASVGNPSSGTLFEIKDDKNLTVNVNVKEVDIEKIREGQKAQIKTDSTGTNIIEGEVINIEQISKDDDNNKLDLSNDSNDKESKYEVKIKINDPSIKLKIGMKAQADIIVDEKNDVYTVPVESVIKDKDNNDCLYVAERHGRDYIIKKIPITKGSETDTNIEVFGQDLKDNMIVLNSPSDYEIGNKIKIKEK